VGAGDAAAAAAPARCDIVMTHGPPSKRSTLPFATHLRAFGHVHARYGAHQRAGGKGVEVCKVLGFD
jgi:hypothetical protein